MPNELLLYGTVGESFWGEESFTVSAVRAQLAGMSGPVTVRINSGGGIATDGQAIYSLLRDYPDRVEVTIDGIAASAASLIAMAGDTITMPAGALLMIHDPAQMFADGRGTEDDHLKTARALRVIADAFAGVYARRAGITAADAREIMRAETYYDGAAAVAAGFATNADDEAEAQAPAAFDYRIYAHAPQELRAAAGPVPRRRPVSSVLAMMAGAATRNAGKEIPMAKRKVTAATAADELDPRDPEEEEIHAEDDADRDEDEPRAEDGDEDEDAPRAETGDADEGGDEDEPRAEDDDEEEETPAVALHRTRSVLAYCTRNGLSMARVNDYLARGLSVAAIIAERGGKGADTVKPGNTRPVARITRDERDTRRQGMEEALVARMSRARDVRGPGRAWMGMTLAEMAAASLGRRGRVARGADANNVITMALGSHSVSDFPAVFENALNKRLAAAYQMALPAYRAVAERIDFTDFRPHPIAQIGDWPSLLPVGETGEIQYGTVSDKKESVFLIPYARAFHISRQMMVNDDLGAIERLLSTRGRAVAAFEDATFFKMMLSGSGADGPTLLETSRQVFNTTDKTKAGTASVVDAANVALGIKALRERKGLDGDSFLAVTPKILLTGPAKEFEARQLMAPITAAEVSEVNPYTGTMEVVVTPYITGNAWYLFASPDEVPVFMYGYLEGEEGPRMRMDEPFGQQGISYSVELDFGCGATDWRGGYKNAGS